MAKPAADVDELPKTIVRRVVKDKLSGLSGDVDINIHKEFIIAFSESARIFIHYLSATANDICRESKRQTNLLLVGLSQSNYYSRCGGGE